MSEQEKFFSNPSFRLCISVWLLQICAALSQIPLGSKLTVVENSFWVSSNGDFALGFFNHSDQPNQYSLGIRFNSKSIPGDKQTVVWVAGAEATVSNKSYFQLTQDGELVLFDSLNGMKMWSSKTGQLSVTSAVLHDNGNLALINEKKDIVWQSFDNPVDTLLPGQNFSVDKTLRAASENSVSSYYSLYMTAFGQLQLRWESSVVYWTSGSSYQLNVSAFLTSNGTLQLQDQNFKPLWSVFGEDHDDSVDFRFLRLDVDGNLRLYSWVNDSKSWRSVWQAVENQCDVFATCDQRGICVYNSSGFPDCTCPFESLPGSNSKCLVRYDQDCKSGSTMILYKHMILYGIYPANDSVYQTSLDQCKSLCLESRQCTAVTYTNDGTAQCRMKMTQYVSGYSNPSLGSLSFVKKCLDDPVAVDPNIPRQSSSSSSLVKRHFKFCVPCLVGAAAGTVIIFILLQFAVGFCIYRRRKTARKTATSILSGTNSKGLFMFSFAEIKDVTRNFKHRIGPTVFKGMILENQPVAVKELEPTIEDRKFRAAASKIRNIHHKNLAKLEGYCCEKNHKYLVYEYCRNGSLEKHIQDSKLSKRLTWRKRLDISRSIGRAISYLHSGCREFIGHGSLKCENVVLDENFEAKVTEYGRGLFCTEAFSHCSPAEKDVEDFGKIVLTLITGRRDLNDICLWSYNEWVEAQAARVIDKRMDDEVDLEELERALRIAFWCLQANKCLRPSIGEVVKVLEGTLTVDPPPPPFACRSPAEEGSEGEFRLG